MEKRVGFGPRLGAFLIDGVLSSLIAFLLAPIIGRILLQAVKSSVAAGNAEQALAGVFAAIGGMILALPVVMFLYFLLEAFVGASLGKMILGLKIANADGTKAKPSTLLTRYVIKQSGPILTLLALLLSLSFLKTLGNIASLGVFIGCFVVLAEKKQAFQDMIAKTAVFKKNDIV